MENNFWLQICGCILILMIIVFIWIIARIANISSYFYKNSNALVSMLSTFAYQNRVKYEDEPQFYSSIVENLKKSLNIDYYFTAHELSGYKKEYGKFSCFLMRTSNNSFFKYSLNRAKLYLSEKFLKKNFAGLVLSYDYALDFTDYFVLFASRDSVYYEKEGGLDYIFLDIFIGFPW